MFTTAPIQSQVCQHFLTPVTQLTSVMPSVRQARKICTYPLAYMRNKSEIVMTVPTENGSSTEEISEGVKDTLKGLGLHELTEGLKVEKINLEDLKPTILKTTPCDTYVSTESFFQNKHGFSEAALMAANMQESVRIFMPKFGHITKKLPTRFIPQSVFHQCTRSFKTQRARDIAGQEALAIEESLIRRHLPKKIFPSQENHKESNNYIKTSFSKLIKDNEDDPQKLNHLYVGFSKGYLAASELKQVKNPKHVWAMILLCVALTSYLLYLLTKGLSGKDLFKTSYQAVDAEDITETFEDVKGCDEAKQELQDVVDFLKDPQKFKSLGARLPKGVLLVGAPGLGKTLLARAVAGEAGVAFFRASGSEFDEMFVGTGARRVRNLFNAAKEKAPCVIFIDEIDTVGGKRSSVKEMHPYADQSVNQLLTEMDGFTQNEGVIVLGATNRRDNLDPALLRPGRFDVEVKVSVPDIKGRTEILELYFAKITHDDSISAENIARRTTGCSGADLENMVNQAALKAALDRAESVTMEHMDYALDKVLMGMAKKSKIQDEETNLSTAFHEAGHTIVAHYTKHSTPLNKVTILARGMSLGHTSFIPETDQYSVKKCELLAKMDVLMGGRVAEEVIYGSDKVTTGASSDFSSATDIATAMVTKFGMSEKVGVRVLEDPGSRMSGGNLISPNMHDLVDAEIKRLLNESYERSTHILKSHEKELRALADALMKYETLDKDEVQTVLKGLPLKKKIIDAKKKKQDQNKKQQGPKKSKDGSQPQGPLNLLKTKDE